jgi:uncharacterized membrane protein
VIEEFFTAHQHTVAALSVLGTLSAVLVSLAIALVSQRANRTRITAHASITFMMHETIDRNKPPTSDFCRS